MSTINNNIQSEKGSVFRTVLVILALIFINPIGLVLMLTMSRWKKWIKILITVLLIPIYVVWIVNISNFIWRFKDDRKFFYAAKTLSPPTTTSFHQPFNSELLGESNSYVVYLVNPRPLEFAGERSGQLQIFKKPSITPIIITKQVNIYGGVRLTNDSFGKYLALSSGFSPTRNIIIVDLLNSQIIGSMFCAGDPILFWQDVAYFGNCDYLNKNTIFDGPLSSISELNLKTNTTKIIFKSNLQTSYKIKKIQDSKLYYYKYQYTNGSKIITTEHSYDLSLL